MSRELSPLIFAIRQTDLSILCLGRTTEPRWLKCCTYIRMVLPHSLLLKTAPPNRSKCSDLHFMVRGDIFSSSPGQVSLIMLINLSERQGWEMDRCSGGGRWCWKRKKRHRDDRIEPFQSCISCIDFRSSSTSIRWWPKIRSFSFYCRFLYLFAVNYHNSIYNKQRHKKQDARTLYWCPSTS